MNKDKNSLIVQRTKTRKFNAGKHKKVLFPQNYLNNNSNSEFQIHFRMLLIWQHQFQYFNMCIYVHQISRTLDLEHCTVINLVRCNKRQNHSRSLSVFLFEYFTICKWKSFHSKNFSFQFILCFCFFICPDSDYGSLKFVGMRYVYLGSKFGMFH